MIHVDLFSGTRRSSKVHTSLGGGVGAWSKWQVIAEYEIYLRFPVGVGATMEPVRHVFSAPMSSAHVIPSTVCNRVDKVFIAHTPPALLSDDGLSSKRQSHEVSACARS